MLSWEVGVRWRFLEVDGFGMCQMLACRIDSNCLEVFDMQKQLDPANPQYPQWNSELTFLSFLLAGAGVDHRKATNACTCFPDGDGSNHFVQDQVLKTP